MFYVGILLTEIALEAPCREIIPCDDLDQAYRLSIW